MPFADRLAALVSERRSQVCLGLDPVPDAEPWCSASVRGRSGDPREAAAAAIELTGRELIEAAGPACVAVKPQLARFEALGAPGWAALERIVADAGQAGLLVLADGKRGDVPMTAAAYGAAMVGSTPTPWGDAPGLGADAFTASPLLGADSLEPLVTAAEVAGAGIFFLVRTSNAGAADVLDLPAGSAPLHERLAAVVARLAPRLRGGSGLSGAGAVVGATEPRYIERLRELMGEAVFLLPGVGAQGGRPEELAPAFAPGRAAGVVAASRGIVAAADPAGAAEGLRERVWEASEAG